MTIKRRLEDSNIGWRTTSVKLLLANRHLQRRLTWVRKNLNPLLARSVCFRTMLNTQLKFIFGDV